MKYIVWIEVPNSHCCHNLKMSSIIRRKIEIVEKQRKAKCSYALCDSL